MEKTAMVKQAGANIRKMVAASAAENRENLKVAACNERVRLGAPGEYQSYSNTAFIGMIGAVDELFKVALHDG